MVRVSSWSRDFFFFWKVLEPVSKQFGTEKIPISEPEEMVLILEIFVLKSTDLGTRRICYRKKVPALVRDFFGTVTLCWLEFCQFCNVLLYLQISLYSFPFAICNLSFVNCWSWSWSERPCVSLPPGWTNFCCCSWRIGCPTERASDRTCICW